MLWTDYFKPPHFEKYPQLNQLFNEATKLAGGGPGGTKSSTDVAAADELLAKIDEISKIFWETKRADPSRARRDGIRGRAGSRLRGLWLRSWNPRSIQGILAGQKGIAGAATRGGALAVARRGR